MNSLTRLIEKNVCNALREDLGLDDDIDLSHPSALQEAIQRDLTAQLVPANQKINATIISRENAVICGIPWAEFTFKLIDPEMNIEWLVQEGEQISPNTLLCKLKGNARKLLTAERTALNFLQTLSATSTATRQFVSKIKDLSACIMDTRKTIPQLRDAQKYAVLQGGGQNQRIGLYDGILIKENHITAAGSIKNALLAAEKVSKVCSIQIEVESIEQLKLALEAGAKLILLDNFSVPMLEQAVMINAKRAILEASGGIDITNVRQIAETGVDRISIGAITKHIRAIDLSMRFDSL